MIARGRRGFLRLASAGALSLALAGVAREAAAAEVGVSATLSSTQVEVGESVYLQVEVETDGGEIGQPRLENLDDVDVESRGTSSGMSVSIGGGRRVSRSTKTFTYVLSPRKAGEFVIDVAVEVDGKLERPATKPKLIASGEPLKPALEVGKAGDVPDDPTQEVIVWPVVDKASVYVGEQIVYELQIWERANANLSVTESPTFKDFWSENLLPEDHARRRRPSGRFISGINYRVHQTMLRALFPQKAGTLTIGGPTIQTQPMVGLFGSGGPPKRFVGRSLAIEVKPLPAAGQPPGFRANNVGSFTISAEVDRSGLRQGEAVRLSVRIAGVGNIALVELPELPELPGLRTYEPKPQTPQFVAGNQARLEGSRVYSVLMVAEEAGELTIPAIELPYFDPATGGYAVAKSKPVVLTVEADPDAAPAPVAERAKPAAEADDEAAELLAPPIAGGSLERTTPREPWLTHERWWAASLTPPALLGFALLGRKLLDRFGPDDQRRERNRELSRRKTLLAEAGAAVESGDGFYPKLAAVLQAAAVGRTGGEGVGLTRDRLMRLLEERGVVRAELDELRELLDACDAARFGAGSGDVDQRRAHLDRGRRLLDKRDWGPA